MQTVQKFISVGSTFLAANPTYLGIMAAIAAGALLIANWDKVKGHGHRPVGGGQAGVRRHPGQRDRGL